MIRLGVVARPHGVRGMVAVTLDDPGGTALLQAERVKLGRTADDPAPVPYAVTRATTGRKGQTLLALEGVVTPEAAELMRGRVVLVEESQLPPLEEGEYRLRDLVGLAAFRPDGEPLGRVDEVVDTAEVPVLVVAARGGEVYVPFADPFVVEVDVPGGRVIVEPPEEA